MIADMLSNNKELNPVVYELSGRGTKFKISLVFPTQCYFDVQKNLGRKSLDISSKKDELKQIENIFAENLMNDLIRAKLKKIVKLQYIIRKINLDRKIKMQKNLQFW